MTLNDPNSRSYARFAGALYLTIAVAGGFAIAYVPSQLHVAGDAAATFANIGANSRLFNFGILGDVVMMSAEVMLTAMLYFMFKAVNPTVSLAAAFARLSMAIVMAAMLMFHAGMLALIDPNSAMTNFTPAQRTDLAALMLHIHDSGVWVWQLFFTLHLALLGWLVAQSGQYPKILGLGMMIGAFGYLLDSLLAFLSPDIAVLGALHIGLLAVVTLSEVGFALWLLFVGPNQSLPKISHRFSIS